MKTQEAFEKLCLNQEKCESIGLNDSTRKSYLRRLRLKQTLSLDKMEEILIKAGYEVKQEKLWKY
jgi:hypothetical protein